MENCILRSKEVVELSGLSLSTISRMEAIGRFPLRRKISKKTVGWLASEVQQWIESTLKKSRSEADNAQ